MMNNDTTERKSVYQRDDYRPYLDLTRPVELVMPVIDGSVPPRLGLHHQYRYLDTNEVVTVPNNSFNKNPDLAAAEDLHQAFSKRMYAAAYSGRMAEEYLQDAEARELQAQRTLAASSFMRYSPDDLAWRTLGVQQTEPERAKWLEITVALAKLSSPDGPLSTWAFMALPTVAAELFKRGVWTPEMHALLAEHQDAGGLAFHAPLKAARFAERVSPNHMGPFSFIAVQPMRMPAHAIQSISHFEQRAAEEGKMAEWEKVSKDGYGSLKAIGSVSVIKPLTSSDMNLISTMDDVRACLKIQYDQHTAHEQKVLMELDSAKFSRYRPKYSRRF